MWSRLVPSSQCGWGKQWVNLDISSLDFLKDTPQWLVLQAVRYGSLKFRGKVRAGNRYVSLSFSPLGLYKSSLICFSDGDPLNTWGQSTSFNSTPLSSWRLSSLGSSHHCPLGGPSSLVVDTHAAQSVVCGSAASPGSCEECSISNSSQIYWVRICITRGSSPFHPHIPHDSGRAHWTHIARVCTLGLMLMSCVWADYLTTLCLSFFFYQMGIISGLTP